MKYGIVELYCGNSGKKGYYNNQEVGLARAMADKGYQVTIFYPRTDISVEQEEVIDSNIMIVYVPAKAIGVHGRYRWDVLERYSIDVVQLGSDNQIFAPSLAKYCSKHSIRLYHYIGTVGSDSANKYKRLVMNLLIKRNIQMLRKHKCFAKTEYVKKQLEKKKVKNVEIVPVGLDTEIIPEIPYEKRELREKLGLPQDTKIVLFVGRIDEYKKPFQALDLLAELQEGNTGNYYLVIIGSGELNQELNERIEAGGLADRICRIERLPNEKVHEYYVACDYFVNFNPNEIFGMSIMEAMYHGCTVLAKHAPGPDCIIENGKSGYLVNSPEEMKQLILRDTTLAKDAVKSRIQAVFTWKNAAQKFHEWIVTGK